MTKFYGLRETYSKYERNSKGVISMIKNKDDVIKEINIELKIDPLKAEYMLRAYEIDPIREYFQRKHPEKRGENAILAYCKSCLCEEDVREKTYHWLSIAEDIGRGRLMFSI